MTAETDGAAGVSNSRPPLRLLAYVAAVTVAASGAGVAVIAADPEPVASPNWWTLPVLGLLLAAAEYLFVRFRYGDDVKTFNMFEAVLAPLLVAFYGWVVLLATAGAQLVASLLRRNEPIKTLFNVAQWTLASGVGVLSLGALTGTGEVTPATLVVLAVVLALVSTVNQGAIAGVLAVVNGQPLGRVLGSLGPMVLTGWLTGWAVNGALGILFVLAYVAHPVAVVLYPVPLAVLHLAYRGMAGVRSDRRRLVGVQRAIGVLGEPLDPTEALGPFLCEAARAFDGRGAALVLAAGDEVVVHRVDLTRDCAHEVERRSQLDATLETELLRLSASQRIVAGNPSELSAAVAAAGWRDCLCSPFDQDGQRGVLLVFDQAGLEGFEAAELAMIEVLARETAGALAKGKLLEVVLDERQKLAEIIDSTSDGILSIDHDGVVRTWNTALERITERAAVEALGKADVLARHDLRTADGSPVHLEAWPYLDELPSAVRITTATGRERHLSCSYSRTVDERGEPTNLVVVARDVTPPEEVELLRRQIGQLARAEAARRDVVDQLQQAVMPPRPTLPATDLAVRYVSSNPTAPTGGDLYDWQVLPSGELHLAVIDVLGHGVRATKDALRVIHTLRLLTFQGCPLERLIEEADAVLAAGDSNVVATAVVARYDPATGLLHVASGGHPPGLVVSPSGAVRALDATGTAIGWPGAGTERIAETSLGPGDTLILYTDGLVEAHKDFLAGLESLVRHASEAVHLPPEELVTHLVESALAGAVRRDDTVTLVLRRLPVLATRRWELAPIPDEVARARRGLQSWLAETGVAGEELDDLTLVASELLTNAVRAARRRVDVRAAVGPSMVELEVSDDGVAREDLHAVGIEAPSDAAESGRGLFLVRSICDEVAVSTSRDAGTSVHVRRAVSVPASSPSSPSSPSSASSPSSPGDGGDRLGRLGPSAQDTTPV